MILEKNTGMYRGTRRLWKMSLKRAREWREMGIQGKDSVCWTCFFSEKKKKTVEPCQVCPPHGLESTRSSSSTCLLKFATLRAHIRCLARQIRQQHANMAPGTMMNIPKKECVYIYIYIYILWRYSPTPMGEDIARTTRKCLSDKVTIEDSFNCLAWVFTLHCDRDDVTMLC